jgi:hypothetical protein
MASRRPLVLKDDKKITELPDGDTLGGVSLRSESFVYTQASAATAWVVEHNLDTDLVELECWDDSGNLLTPTSAVQDDTNNMTINFGSSVAGKAIISPVVEIGAGASPPGGTDPVSDYVERWTMDDNTGTSVNGNDGTWYGTPVTVAGKIGDAQSANADSYMEVLKNNTIDIAGAFTFTGWFLPTDTGDTASRHVVGRLVAAGTIGYTIHQTGGTDLQVILGTSTGGLYTATFSGLVQSQWHFFVASWNGTDTVSISVNDSTPVTAATAGSLTQPYTHELSFGARPDTHANGIKGYLDDMRLYDRELTAQEITDLFTWDGVEGPAPSPATSIAVSSITDIYSPSTYEITHAVVRMITGDKGIMSYGGSDSGNKVYVRGFSTAGGTITLGPLLTIAKYANISGCGMVRVNDNRVLVATRQGADVHLIDWDQNTANAPTLVDTHSIASFNNENNFVMEVLEDNKFLLGATAQVVVVEVSGDTVSSGTVLTSTATYTPMGVVSPTKVWSGYADMTHFTITGTTVSEGSIIPFTPSAANEIQAAYTDTDRVLVTNNNSLGDLSYINTSGVDPAEVFTGDSTLSNTGFNRDGKHFIFEADGAGRFVCIRHNADHSYEAALALVEDSGVTLLDSAEVVAAGGGTNAGGVDIDRVVGSTSQFVGMFWEGAAAAAGNLRVFLIDLS